MTQGSSGEGRTGYLPKNVERSVWENMAESEKTRCFKCNKRISKHWHISKEEMNLCGNCFNKRK